MIVQNQTIKKCHVSLDGETFIQCSFINCKLIYSGLMPISLKNCTFENCNWSFSGPAKNTITFMKGLYSLDGSTSVVIEKVFEQIRTDTCETNHILNNENIIN